MSASNYKFYDDNVDDFPGWEVGDDLADHEDQEQIASFFDEYFGVKGKTYTVEEILKGYVPSHEQRAYDPEHDEHNVNFVRRAVVTHPVTEVQAGSLSLACKKIVEHENEVCGFAKDEDANDAARRVYKTTVAHAGGPSGENLQSVLDETSYHDLWKGCVIDKWIKGQAFDQLAVPLPLGYKREREGPLSAASHIAGVICERLKGMLSPEPNELCQPDYVWLAKTLAFCFLEEKYKKSERLLALNRLVSTTWYVASSFFKIDGYNCISIRSMLNRGVFISGLNYKRREVKPVIPYWESRDGHDPREGVRLDFYADIFNKVSTEINWLPELQQEIKLKSLCVESDLPRETKVIFRIKEGDPRIKDVNNYYSLPRFVSLSSEVITQMKVDETALNVEKLSFGFRAAPDEVGW